MIFGLLFGSGDSTLAYGLFRCRGGNFLNKEYGMKKTEKERTERAAAVLTLLKKRYPEPETMLNHTSPWELLVATVLAAQCTDARVNTITPELFRRWPDPAALTAATQEELEEVIRPTGFYHNKAKNLLGAARRVTEVFGGQVPQTIEELITIPGVARKTANVVLWGGFGLNQGLAVDTHVKRLSFRLGLTEHTEPVKIEKDLMQLFPREEWGDVNHRLVWFGRDVCDARKPACDRCELAALCPRCGVKVASGKKAPRAAASQTKETS